MQGQRSAIDPIPENVDISLGSFPNNDIMSEQAYISNRSNPDGNCFSNYMDSSVAAASNSSGHGSGLGGWSLGQSSSLPSSESQLRCDEMKMEFGWFPTRSVCAGAGPSSAGRELEPHNAFFSGIPSGNQVTSRHVGYAGSGESIAQEYGPSVGYSADKSHVSELDSTTSFGASLRNSGNSSGSSMQMEDKTGGSSSSMAAWGTSYKRKAFEGTSGPSQPSTSSGCTPEDDNLSWPNEPSSSNNNPPDIVNLSPPSSWNSSRVNFLEQMGPSSAVGSRKASNESFPPLSITGSAVNSRSISRGSSSGHPQEPVPYSLSSAGTGIGRRLNAFPLNHLQRPGPSGDSLDLRSSRGVSANTNPSLTQSNSVHAPRLSRNMQAFPWNGASHSRNGNFLNSSFIPGEIDLGSRDEPNLRGIPRYSPENLAVSPDSRNMAQDPTSWNIAAGSSSRASGLPSSSGAGPSSSSWSSNPSWASHRRVAPNRPRSVESAHWSLFPPVESESGGQSSHFSLPSSGNSTPQEHAVASGSTSQSHRQQFHRSAFSIDRGGDLVGMSESLRALSADFEGRHRILAEIRQVLNAVRRGENLRAEDYMFFEPIMFQSLAEMHDRHRDMRLDVDNMSYEELLALEERIGDVNTGLNEETILKHMKQQKKRISSQTEAMQDPEPCCVCQEEYVEGEDVGLLDCGHDFHVECIKQWLMHKNLCPICKTTGLVI